MKTTTLCYIEKDHKYLMLHRTKKKNDASEGKWIGVGGKVEPGESVEECLLREVFEETNLTLKAYEKRGVIHFKSDQWEEETMHIYTATDFTGNLVGDCVEGELAWIPIDEIEKLPLWEGDRIFLKKLQECNEKFYMTYTYTGEKLSEVLDYIENSEILAEK